MVPLGVERSRWFGELAQAIDDAQRVVWEIGSSVGLSADALDLYARLEVVRDEVERMRLARLAVETRPERPLFGRSDTFQALSP